MKTQHEDTQNMRLCTFPSIVSCNSVSELTPQTEAWWGQKAKGANSRLPEATFVVLGVTM